MDSELIALIDKCIECAESHDSRNFYRTYDALDRVLGTEGRDCNIRSFFDSWCDAVGHEYQIYSERDPKVWKEAAIELREWYLSKTKLSQRELWKECWVTLA